MICFLSPNRTNLRLVFLVPLLSERCPVGLCCCHSLSPSLSASLVVSIIHHLHSQAIYTTFYSQSAFTLCCLHLSTAIQIFRPVWAVLGRPATSGPEKCIRWLPHINKSVPNEWFKTKQKKKLPCCALFWREVKRSLLSQVNHNLWQPIRETSKGPCIYSAKQAPLRLAHCTINASFTQVAAGATTQLTVTTCLQLATCLRACDCARPFAGLRRTRSVRSHGIALFQN